MFNTLPGFKVLFAPDEGGAAGGAGQGAAAPSAASTENAVTADTNDILSTLKHDPFPGGEEAPKAKVKESAPKGAGKAKADKGAKADGADGKSPDGGGAAAQPGTQGAASDPEKDALKQSLDHATQLLEAYKAGGRGTPAPAGGTKPAAETKPDAPNFNFTIPDQLVQALTNEDPQVFKQGLAGMAMGVGQGVFNEVSKHLPQMVEQRINQILPQLVQHAMTQQNEVKTIFDDFYGKNPELNKPELYPLVSRIAAQVQAEMKTDKWSPAIRDLVAQKTKALIASVTGGAQNGTAADALSGKPKNGGGHPVMFGGNNSRGATTGGASAEEQDIIATLFGDS